MDLRNLSSTPNQLDSVMQRRPSLSSLSSASGYASSNYGGNTTPQISKQRMSQARNFGNGNSNSSTNLQSAWLNQGQISSASGQPLNQPLNQHVVNTVGPWVEQQQAQQQAGVASLSGLDSKVIPPNLNNKNSSSINDNDNDNEVRQNAANDNNDDDDDDIDDDDELIPTAIVIKNIPFAIKKEQLLDVMTKLNLPLPYAFNYHFDNGVFRGLAFANFTLTDETSSVVGLLNGREIGGRKLRVEYKKMLPAQERERIEREKREKRGQLEEQHRSTSNASLASLLSAASTTAATKNLSVNGTSNNQTERLFITFPSASGNLPSPPSELNLNDPEILELYSQLILYRDDMAKSIFELAFPSSLGIAHRKILSILCSYLNLLELYDNGLIIIRRKQGQQPAHLTQQSSAPQHSSSMMNLNQLPGIVSNPPNGVTPAAHPELLRSQSQSALQMPRLRQQSSTPVQQNFPQYQQQPQGQQQSQLSHPQASGSQSQAQPPHQSQSQQQSQRPLYSSNISQVQPYNMFQQPPAGHGQSQQVATPTMGSSSAAALLRSSNNRSYVDVRSTPPLSTTFSQPPQSGNESPTPQHYHFANSNSNNQISQPTTPLANTDINSRFAPFGQHAHLTGSFSSLHNSTNNASSQGPPNPQASQTNEEFADPEVFANKFNSINLSGNYENSNMSNSGIWGPK